MMRLCRRDGSDSKGEELIDFPPLLLRCCSGRVRAATRYFSDANFGAGRGRCSSGSLSISDRPQVSCASGPAALSV